LALKKQRFAEGEIAIFDEACIYKRGEGLTNNTVTSIEQPRRLKLGFKPKNFVQQFSVVEYLQK
jgi:hypothetical protein